MSRIKHKFWKIIIGVILLSGLSFGTYLLGSINGNRSGTSSQQIASSTSTLVSQPVENNTSVANNNEIQKDFHNDVINLGDYNLILSQKQVVDPDLTERVATFIGIYNYLLVPMSEPVEVDGFSHIQLIDQEKPSLGFIATNDQNQFAKFSFALNQSVKCEFEQKNLATILPLGGASLEFIPGSWMNPNGLMINVLYMFNTNSVNHQINYWIWDLDNNSLQTVANRPETIMVGDNNYTFDRLQLVKNFSFNGSFHTFFNSTNSTTPAGWIYLTNYVVNKETKITSQMLGSEWKYSKLVNVGWNQWSEINSFIGQGINQNRFYYFSMPATIDQLAQFPLYVTWVDQDTVDLASKYFEQILFLNPKNSPAFQGMWVLTNQHKSVKFVDLRYSYNSFETFGSRDTIRQTLSGLNTRVDVNKLGQTDNISQIVYNAKINRLMVIYNYNNELASYNFNVDGESLNIVPITINYDEFKKLSLTWKTLFSSQYTKSLKSSSITPLLNISGYYSKLYTNDDFGLLLHANDLFGTLQMQLQIIDPYFQQNVISIFNHPFYGFKKIDLNQLGKYTISNSSPILSLTPSELRKQLDDTTLVHPGSDQTIGQFIKQEIFNLFGFEEQYKNLNYSIEIGSSTVFGRVELKVNFQTIFDEKIGSIYKSANIVDDQNTKPQQSSKTPDTKSPQATPAVAQAINQPFNHYSALANDDADLASVSFEHRFKLKMEKWLMPVIITSSVVVASFIFLGVGLKFRKQIKRKFVDLLNKYDNTNKAKNGEPEKTVMLTEDDDRSHELVTQAKQITKPARPQSTKHSHFDSYNRFQNFLSDLNQKKQWTTTVIEG